MILKSYVVKDRREALQLIKRELGSDATIISEKKKRQKGLFSFFKKKVLEVTVAFDRTPTDQQLKNDILEQTMSFNKNVLEEVGKIKELVNETLKNGVQMSMPLEPSSEYDLKFAVTELFDQYDFVPEIKNKFLKMMVELNYKPSQVSLLALYQFINLTLNKKAKIGGGLRKKVNFFVGPTGVGKTTTIAKIASNEILDNRSKIAFVTLDTYRIAAVDQLKTYSQILNIPIKICYSVNEFAEAMLAFKDFDYILVDTTGRSMDMLDEVEEYIQYANNYRNHEVHLVLNPATKSYDFRELVKRYKKHNYSSIILTKLDENTINENIINMVTYCDVPINYLCFGQQVPNDISKATKDKLFEFAWKKGGMR